MTLTLDPLKPYADLIRWGVGLLLVVVVLFAGYRWGAGRWEAKFEAERTAHAATRDLHAAVLAGLAQHTAALEQRAKDATAALAEAGRTNDDRYDKAVDDAKRARADLERALRRGSVQLRPEWTCAAPGPGAGEAAAAPGGDADAADLRAAGAADLVAAADRADAQVAWLQSELTSTRQAVVAAGCAREAAR